MSVSILPVGFYLLYIYQKYRDVQHAISSTGTAAGQEELKNNFFDQDTKQSNPDERNFTIAGTGKREKYVFQSKNLILIVAEDNYIIVHSMENQKLKKWMIRATMNEVENQLNADFIRIHRSYIINKNYIDHITGNVTNTRLKLQSIDGELPVSRGKVAAIRQLQ
jgi:DNA-binding LytR/AlgR family response regulator